MKPMLKGPGTERLKLNQEKLLSAFALKFNLRRYNLVVNTRAAAREAGAYTRSHFSST